MLTWPLKERQSDAAANESPRSDSKVEIDSAALRTESRAAIHTVGPRPGVAVEPRSRFRPREGILPLAMITVPGAALTVGA